MPFSVRSPVGSPIASTSFAGLMPAADKTKLDKSVSGTYTPTMAGVLNIDSVTSSLAKYIRVGDVVCVFGILTADATASSTTTLVSISLPVASNFGAATDADGVASNYGGRLYADAASDLLILNYFVSTASAVTFAYSAMYRVI